MKAIIYDNDGMLTKSEQFSDAYAEKFGLDVSIMAPFFNGPFKKCLVGQADLKTELSKVVKEWKWEGTVDELLDLWFSYGDKPYQNVFDSVMKLKDQGLLVCLATNNEEYRTKYLVEKFRYNDLFDVLFTAYELGAYKHSDEGLEKMAGILELKHGIKDRREIIYWDDRVGNVETINKHGFRAELYTNFDNFKKVLSELGYEV